MKKLYLLILICFIGIGYIKGQSLNLTQPVQNQIIQSGSSLAITWSSQNIGNLKIEFSNDSGRTFSVIQSNAIAGLGFYNWLVPNVGSDFCKIKLSDLNSNLSVTSQGFFKILPPTLRLIYPLGGEIFSPNQGMAIQWEGVGTGNFKIEYSINSGVTWNLVYAKIPVNSSFINWSVPNIPNATVLLRLMGDSSLSIGDTSNFFSIGSAIPGPNPIKFHGGFFDGYSIKNNLQDSLKVMSLNAFTTLRAFETYTINWVSNNLENLYLEFSIDNGLNWTIIDSNISASRGSYNWQVPSASSNFCRIRMRDAQSVVNDLNDSAFQILPPSIEIQYPTSSAEFHPGQGTYVHWNAVSVDSVKIEYSINNGTFWYPIATKIPASWSYYNYTIPNFPLSNLKLRVVDNKNSNIADTTSGIVIKANLPNHSDVKYRGGYYDGYSLKSNISDSIRLLNLNGGQNLEANQKINITWFSQNLDLIKIEYSTDSGQTWNLITNSTPASSSNYLWTVPKTYSGKCLLKLTDSQSNLSDLSDSTFAILPPIVQVEYPSDAIYLDGGQGIAIHWSSFSVEFVKIEYSLNAGQSWNTITPKINAKDAYFNWSVPNVSSNQLFLKVSNLDSLVINDQSNFGSSIKTINHTGDPTKFRGGFYDGFDHFSFTNVNTVPVISSTINGSDSICQNSIQSFWIPKVLLADSYNWNIPNGWQILSNLGDTLINCLTDSNSGRVSITAWNIIGPSNLVYKDITIIKKQINQAGIDKTICKGDSVEIGNSAIGGHVYAWLNSSGTFVKYGAKINVSPEITTFYILRDSISGSGCVSYDTVLINVNPRPIVNLGNDLEICRGSLVQLGSGSAINHIYKWSSIPQGFSSNQSSILVTPGTQISYILLDSNLINGCFNRDTVTINLKNRINLIAEDTIRSCFDSIIVQAAMNQQSYLWSTGSTLESTYKKGSGWLFCDAIDSLGCNIKDSGFVILLNANILENDTSACNVGFLTLHLPSNANLNGTSILWSEGGTGTSAQINLNPLLVPVPDNDDDPNDLLVVPTITYPYTKKVWVKLTNGPLVCTDTLRVVIYQPGILNLSDSLLLVNGQTATIKGDSGFANYSWSNGTMTRNTTTNQNGLLRLNAWNGAGCVSSDSIRIIVIQGIAQDTIKACGDSILISAGNQQANTIWSTAQTGNSIYAKSTGWYKCTYSLGTLSNSDSVFVSLVKAKILASSQIICKGSTATIYADSIQTTYRICNINQIPGSLTQNMVGFFPFCNTIVNQVDLTGGISQNLNQVSDRFYTNNGAYYFDGTSAFLEPSSLSVSNSSNLTVIAKIKPELRTETQSFFPSNIVSNDLPGNYGRGIGVNITNTYSKITVEYQNGFREIPYSFQLNNWYTIGVVYSVNNFKTYVNGMMVDSFNYTPTISGMSTGFSIGKFNNDASTYGSRRFFKGVIDEVVVWSRALTLNEMSVFHSMDYLRQYLWSNNSSNSSITVNPTQTSTYKLRVSNGISFCEDSITIVVDSIVAPNLADTILVCGDSILLNAGNYSSYLWSNGASSQSTYIKTSGWNFVTLTNGLNCSLRDSFYIVFTTKPHINISSAGSTSICPGSSVNLSSAIVNGYNYYWYKNGNLLLGQTNNTLTASSTGLYRLIVNNGFNCADTSNSIQVNQLPLGSYLTNQIPHRALLFKGASSTSINTLSNWLIFDSIQQEFSLPIGLPSSNSIVMVPSTGVCVSNNPVLNSAFEIKDLYIDTMASLDIANQTITASKVNSFGSIKSNLASIVLINNLNQQSFLRFDSVQNKVANFVFNLNGGIVSINSQLRIIQNLNPVSGSLITNGNLILQSDQSGTARILKGTGNYLQDSVVIERYLPGSSGRRYRYLSAPFANGPSLYNSWQNDIHITGIGTGGNPCPNLSNNSNGFDVTITNAASLFTFNETTAQNTNSIGTGGGGTLYQNAWQGVPSTYYTNLQAGKGYRVFYRGNRLQGCDLLNGQNPNPTDAVLKAKGIVQTGVFNFTITYSPNNGEGWNLLGNPYPCPIDWNASNGWTKQNIMNQIWIFRPAGNHFANWNGALGIGVNFGNNIIESGSSFFVKATAANPVLSINENAKIGNSPPVHLFKSAPKVLRLRVIKPNEVDDEFALAMLPEALNTQDNFDSEKMSNPWLNVYSINSDGKKNGINSIAPIQTEMAIPLGFGSSYTGLHRFSFKGLDEYINYDILLWDKYLGIIQMIHDRNTYEFNFSGGANIENRFLLVLVNRGDPDYLKTKDKYISKAESSLLISPNPAVQTTTIESFGLKGNYAKLIVYNSIGKEVIQEFVPITKGFVLIEKSIENWAAGAYEIILMDENGTRKSGRLIKQ